MAAQGQVEHRVNDRIRAREIRLIDAEGQQAGVVSVAEALAAARDADLDLVEISPDANPPVCKIMDYERFKYEARQRAKEARKKSVSTTVKEMKYRPKIGSGDFDTKTRQVEKFLLEGHKVKVTIMFRGREMSHPELGMKILQEIAEKVSAVSKVEATARLDGRNMTMVLGPEKHKAAPKKPEPAKGPATKPATQPTASAAAPATESPAASATPEATVAKEASAVVSTGTAAVSESVEAQEA